MVVIIGSVALLWQNAKCNVNPGLSYFERCALASTHLLANFHFHFAFCQSKTTTEVNCQKEGLLESWKLIAVLCLIPSILSIKMFQISISAYWMQIWCWIKKLKLGQGLTHHILACVLTNNPTVIWVTRQLILAYPRLEIFWNAGNHS